MIMCVCVYIRMFVCPACVRTSINLSVYAFVCVFSCIRQLVCVYPRVCPCVNVYMCVFVYVPMCLKIELDMLASVM